VERARRRSTQENNLARPNDKLNNAYKLKEEKGDSTSMFSNDNPLAKSKPKSDESGGGFSGTNPLAGRGK